MRTKGRFILIINCLINWEVFVYYVFHFVSPSFLSLRLRLCLIEPSRSCWVTADLRVRVQLLRESKAGRPPRAMHMYPAATNRPFSCASAPYLPHVFANNGARKQSRELEGRVAAGSVRRPRLVGHHQASATFVFVPCGLFDSDTSG
jgi:hypothetical protein